MQLSPILERFLSDQYKTYPIEPFTFLMVSVYGEVFDTRSLKHYSLSTLRAQTAVTATNPITKKLEHLPVRKLVQEAWKDTPIQDLPKNTYYLKYLVLQQIYFSLGTDKKKLITEEYVPWYSYNPNYALYVSDVGDIWSDYTRFPLRTYNRESGYPFVSLSVKDSPRTVRRYPIHRLVAQAFIPIPSYLLNKGYTWKNLVVNHKNGLKNDNRVENLEWCTEEENAQHAVTTGLVKHKEYNHILPSI